MRRFYLPVLLSLLASVTTGQQAPFIPVTGANAPKGPSFLLAAKRGGLWLGGMEAGAEGLTYFDGSRFFTPVANFPKITVSGMVEDTQGGIWIASTSGIFRVFQGRVGKELDGVASRGGIVKVGENLFLASVSAPNGDQSNVDVIRIAKSSGSWRLQPFTRDFPARNLLNADRAGNVTFVCPGGYCEWRADDIRHWSEGEVVRSMEHASAFQFPNTLSQVYRDSRNCVWFTNYRDGVLYQCGEDAKPAKLREAIVGPSIRILETLSGDVVIPTSSRMIVGRPGHWRLLTPALGYPVPASVLQQSDGNLWIGNGNGLFTFSAQTKMEFWSERDGVNGVVRAVTPSGDVVFAATGDELRILDTDRSRWHSVGIVSANALLAGPGNSVVVGSVNRGVLQVNAVGTVLRASPLGRVSTLARTRDGQVWAGGDQIMHAKMAGRKITLEPAVESPSQINISELETDGTGELWGCTDAGLIHRGRTGWRLFSKNDGLLKRPCGSLAFDGNGDIWCGYNGMDASAFTWIQKPGSEVPLIHHFLNGGDVGNAVNNFIHADRRGWLWRGTQDGLYVATLEEAHAGRWLYLNRSDGLPSPDTNALSLFEDKDGSLWFGMGTNVVHFSPPNDFLHPNYAPSVFVSGFSFDDGVFRMAESVGNIKNGATVTANIGSLQRDRRNSMRLRYRLMPDGSGWRSTRSLDIPLGKISPGTHTLEVQARLFTGPWSQTVRQPLLVRKPLWLEWPALFSFVLIGGGTAFGAAVAHRRREQKLRVELPGLAEWRMAALSPQTSSEEGAVLDGRFEVGRLLARGGFGTVFMGRDLRNENRPCAVKIFRQEFKDKDWIERRFQQEVSALTQICHPNVVRIYGHGTAQNGAPYLAMEFIEGETLRDLLSRSRLSRKRIAAYLRQIGSALHEIHAHNVCHRDLKPENLIIRTQAAPGREIVLIDFSIAIVKDPDETMHGLSRAAGTLLYMAPEQGIGYADASSDIYSLAKILLEMLTGQQLNALLPNASIDLPARVRELLAESSFGLSAGSVDLIATALEFHPYSRAHDASSFADHISRDLEK